VTTSDALKSAAGSTVFIFAEGTAIGSFGPTLRDIFGPRAVFEVGVRELGSPAILAKADLVVLPGVPSEYSPYPQLLTPSVQSAISGALRNGAAVWSDCAAGYISCASYHYNSATRQVEPRTGLGLFEGHAWGPVADCTPGASEETRFSDVRHVRVVFNDGADRKVRTSICYSNGGAYNPAQAEAIHVIARYDKVKGRPIAAAVKAVGKGNVLFSGILPEMSATEMVRDLDGKDRENYPHLVKLYRASTRYEQRRRSLLERYVGALGFRI
jgi:glutamine amidotransferase-like uncharacterized protein